MFDNKEKNRSAITDFSEPRKSVFSLPPSKERTVGKGSNSNHIYMIFGVLGFALVSVLIYMFISYLLSIKTIAHFVISVTIIVTIFVIAVIVLRTIYPRRPIEKDGDDDDL